MPSADGRRVDRDATKVKGDGGCGDEQKTTDDGGGREVMADYQTLEDNVINWAEAKGILHEGTTIAQAEKTLEEAQEIKDAIEEGDRDKLIDALGDTLVTLIVQSEMQGLDLSYCLEVAWNEIKDRKGEMVNGQFVKREVEG